MLRKGWVLLSSLGAFSDKVFKAVTDKVIVFFLVSQMLQTDRTSLNKALRVLQTDRTSLIRALRRGDRMLNEWISKCLKWDLFIDLCFLLIDLKFQIYERSSSVLYCSGSLLFIINVYEIVSHDWKRDWLSHLWGQSELKTYSDFTSEIIYILSFIISQKCEKTVKLREEVKELLLSLNQLIIDAAVIS